MYLYITPIKVTWQVVHRSIGAENLLQSSAGGIAEGVPTLHRRPTRPSGARVHQVGVPGPILDESSCRDLHGGFPACERVLLATIHWAKVHRET